MVICTLSEINDTCKTPNETTMKYKKKIRGYLLFFVYLLLSPSSYLSQSVNDIVCVRMYVFLCVSFIMYKTQCLFKSSCVFLCDLMCLFCECHTLCDFTLCTSDCVYVFISVFIFDYIFIL